MKVTPKLVKLFEREQKKYGTDVALHNFQWLSVTDQMRQLGATHIETEYDQPKTKKRSR
jgi:hypothetical protein